MNGRGTIAGRESADLIEARRSGIQPWLEF